METLEILSFLIIYICLPVTVIVTLVYSIILLKQMTITIKKVDDLTIKVNEKIELLDGPINTITKINSGYLKVAKNLAMGFATVGAFARKKKR